MTAADSNTDAIAGLTVRGMSPESSNSSLWMKVVWGIAIGGIAWAMVSFAGVDGVKMLSNLGGLPSLFLCLGVCGGLIWLLVRRGWRD